MNLNKNIGLTYADVLLVPQRGIVQSRNDVDLSSRLTSSRRIEGNIKLSIPICSAPMSSVTEADLAIALFNKGGYGFIHRNLSINDQVDEFLKVKKVKAKAGCAIGVNESYKKRLCLLMGAGCECFILDVAHAHNDHIMKWLDKIPDSILSEIEIIVGSISTPEAVLYFLNRFPVSAFRIGQGSGSVCSTRGRTGFGYPQLTAIDECARIAGHIPIIADGGINNSDDIVKALAAGASTVMLGRLLARAREASKPGEYYGMASSKAKAEIGLRDAYIEGESVLNPGILPPLEEIIDDLLCGIRSGISYGGGSNIRGLQEKHEFIRISESTKVENNIRI